MAVRRLPPYLVGREIAIVTSNQAAIHVINKPKQQSGQASTIQIYEANQKLKEGRNRVLLRWAPAQEEFQLNRDAKRAARQGGRLPQKQFYSAKLTVINAAKAEIRKHKMLPEGVGKHLKKIDTAIPGRHTSKLYDAFGRNEAWVLHSYGPAWHGSMGTCIRSVRLTLIGAPADKLEKLWNAFSLTAHCWRCTGTA